MMLVALDLLLITGAGASRNLGVGDSQLPLMEHWAQTLCETLDQQQPGLAAACGLGPTLNGHDFEQALGELLEWEGVRHLEQKFEALGRPNMGGQTKPGVLEARQQTGERLMDFKLALNDTLYRQFSHKAVDEKKAVKAYGGLLAQFGRSRIVIATTNYDRSTESALIGLKRRIRNGFSGEPPRRQLFRSGNLVQGAGDDTPLLHLHGAVGWYERNGEIVLEDAEERFDPSRGSPVVLYPDPKKEPKENAVVAELWREFDIAIENVRSVVVLGHSLHDNMLVDRLERLAPEQKLAVSVFSDADRERATELLPGAFIFELDFQPGVSLDQAMLKHLDL